MALSIEPLVKRHAFQRRNFDVVLSCLLRAYYVTNLEKYVII